MNFPAVERVCLGIITSFETYNNVPTLVTVPPVAHSLVREPNVLNNLYTFGSDASDASGVAENHQERFHSVDVQLDFLSGTSTNVACYSSRANAAGLRDMATDAADSWGSYGKQTLYANALTGAGGNAARFTARCAKYLAFVCSGGFTGTLYVYGVLDRRGGV